MTQKEMEEKLAELQAVQKQLQMIMMQKQQFQLHLEEVKAANEELVKSKGAVYKAAGGLLLESSKADAEKELKEKMESAELRVSVLTKQEEKLKSRFNELREKFEAAAGKK